jgi:hypothetical protein
MTVMIVKLDEASVWEAIHGYVNLRIADELEAGEVRLSVGEDGGVSAEVDVYEAEKSEAFGE